MICLHKPNQISTKLPIYIYLTALGEGLGMRLIRHLRELSGD